MTHKIAFIGLGNMGGGMAANQAKAGHAVAAFDLSQAALDRAAAAGCAPVGSVAEAVKDPKVKERLDPTGADLVANTPAQFRTWIAGQRELLGKLIAEAGIKLE